MDRRRHCSALITKMSLRHMARPSSISFSDRCARPPGLCEAINPRAEAGGQLINSTFAETGPQQCSNSPVVRYSPEALQTEFGELFVLQEHTVETYITPSGSRLEFVYCRFITRGRIRCANIPTRLRIIGRTATVFC